MVTAAWVQAQQLPMAAGSTTRQQVVAWASQVQLIRCGSLKLSKELGCHRSISVARLSARADVLAAAVSDRARVKLLPVPASQLDLHAQLRSPEAHTLLLRRGGPALLMCMSSDGQRLVVLSGHDGGHNTCVQVSTFHGHALTGTLSVPKTAVERISSLHAAADAWFLVIRATHHGYIAVSRVLVGTLAGVLIASHPHVPARGWMCSAQDACLVGAATMGDALHICSAASGMQSVSLDTQPRLALELRVSLRGALAAVRSTGQGTDQVFWVDVRHMRVLHHLQLGPPDLSTRYIGNIAAGASSVAIWAPGSGLVRVLAPAGAGQGRQLFSHVGTSSRDEALACFDSVLGTYLALVSADLSIAIRHGVSGQLVALCALSDAGLQASLGLLELSWLPAGAGVVCKTACAGASSGGMDLWSVLSFAAPGT